MQNTWGKNEPRWQEWCCALKEAQSLTRWLNLLCWDVTESPWIKIWYLRRKSILIGQYYHSQRRMERGSMVHLGALREALAAEQSLKGGSRHSHADSVIITLGPWNQGKLSDPTNDCFLKQLNGELTGGEALLNVFLTSFLISGSKCNCQSTSKLKVLRDTLAGEKGKRKPHKPNQKVNLW